MLRAWLISNKSQRGFSAVEALLAATVFAFLVSGLIGAIIYGRGATADAGVHNRAAHLAEEGIEATRNIGNASYGNLTNGTFGLLQSGGIWTFSGASDTSDIYTRQVTIADSGTNRKQITSTVSWTVNGNTSNVTLTSRVSNWEAAIIPATSWPNAILAGSLDLSGTVDAVKVATSGNYAYVIRGSGTNNFSVINIANPAAPTLVGSLTLAGTPTDIDVSGNFAYVSNAADTTEFQVVNVATPTAPTLSRTLDLAGTANATSVAVSGNYAYVGRLFSSTTNSFELTVVNITTPASAVAAGGYNHASIGINDVYVNGNYAYVATTATNPMTLAINVTSPATPTLAGSYAPPLAFSAPLAITGAGTYIHMGYSGLLDSLSIANPAAPSHVGGFTMMSGNFLSFDTDSTGQYLFTGTSTITGEFHIFNVSNPAAPTSARVLDLTGSPGTLNGVAYNASLDIVVGVGITDTQEVRIFTKN